MIDVEQVKRNVDFKAIVEKYTDLQQIKADQFKGRCPFPHHSDSTPSFTVNTDKKVFNCFGCGESGDVIDFVSIMENIHFKQALDKLCDGQEISQCNISYKNNRDFIKLVQQLKKVKSNDNFGEHLVERYKENQHQLFADQYSKETLEYFDIGYCYDPVDKLHERVTIPWRDEEGKLIALVGRDTTGNSNAKYKAAPGSDKKNHLYNLNNAKRYADEGIVVVEDEKSVLRASEYGKYNFVAMGHGKLGDRKFLLRK